MMFKLLYIPGEILSPEGAFEGKAVYKNGE